MLSCREITRLYSESLERPLPFRQRLGLWMHLQMCSLCKGFAKHLTLLRDASRMYAEEIELRDPNLAMPPETRERIGATLRRTDS